MQGLLVMGLLWTAGFTPQAVHQGASEETRFHRIHLRNGNIIEGLLMRETPSEVVLQLSFGEMAIRRDQIQRVELVRMHSKTEPEAVKKAAAYEREEPEQLPSHASKPQGERSSSLGRSLRRPPELPDGVRKQLEALISHWKLTVSLKESASEEELARTIQELGPEAIPYLAWLVAQSPPSLPPKAIALALGHAGGSFAQAALGELLKHKNPELRRAAAEGLAESGDAAQPYLLDALDDESVEVWQAASRGLADLIRKGSEPCLRAVVARMAKAKAKVPHAITLGQAGTQDAHRELVQLFQEADEPSKIAALQGLNLTRDPEDVAILLRDLSTGSITVRKEICLFLGKVKARSGVADLIALLSEDDLGLRSNAHWALKEITGQQLLADPDLWKTWWETTGSKE